MKLANSICRLLIATALSLYLATNALAQAQLGDLALVNPSPTLGGGSLRGKDVCVGNDGFIYSATADGIVQYDHERWLLIRHPNGTEANSVGVSLSGEVLAGFPNDFGLIQRHGGAKPEFRSYRDRVGHGGVELGRCLRIHAIEQLVYFGFEKGVVTWNKRPSREMPEWKLHLFAKEKELATSYSLVNDELIIAKFSNGLHRFRNGSLTPLIDQEDGSNDGFLECFVVGCVNDQNDRLLVATYQKGLFTVDGNGVCAFLDSEVSTWAKASAAKGIVSVDEYRHVLTGERGLIFFDENGCVLDQIDGKKGVGAFWNAGVLDHEGSLLVPVMGNGPFVRINLASPVRILELADLIPFWCQPFQSSIYVGGASSDGIIRLDCGSSGKIKELSRVDTDFEISQSFCCLQFDNQLLVATNDGLLVLDSTGVTQRIEGGYLTSGVIMPDGKTVIFGSDSGRLFSYEVDDGNWKQTIVIDLGLMDALDLTVSDDGDWLWCGAADKLRRRRLCQIPIDQKSGKLTADSKPIWYEASATTGRGKLSRWNKHIVFASDRGLLVYHEEKKTFRPIRELMASCPSELSQRLWRIKCDSSGSLWVVTLDGQIIRVSSDEVFDVPIKLSDGQHLEYFLRADDEVWGYLSDGSILMFPAETMSVESNVPVVLTQVAFGNSPSLDASNGGMTMPFGAPPLRFQYSAPSSLRMPKAPYQYRLVGLSETWSDWSSDSNQTFHGLPWGEYRFEVRARDCRFNISSATIWEFTIAPPWYRTWTTAFVVGFLLMALIGSAYLWKANSNRKRMELLEKSIDDRTRELATSHEKYRTLVEGLESNYVFFAWDPSGRITYVSPSIENVLGYEQTTVVGLNWRKLIEPGCDGTPQQVMPRQSSRLQKFFERGTSAMEGNTCEVSLIHVDGSRRQFELTRIAANSSTRYNGELECIAKDVTELNIARCNLEDAKSNLEHQVKLRTSELQQTNVQLTKQVEERRIAEQLLQESEQNYRSIVEDQNELIVRFDRQGNIEFANKAYMRANALTTHDVGQANLFNVILEDERETVKKTLSLITVEAPFQSHRMRVVRPDGGVEWEDWNCRGLFDDEGEFLCYQAVGRNVTRLIEAQNLLREKEEHLRHVSRLSSLGEMAAGITHEIRQPLGSISNFAFAASKSLESGEVKSPRQLLDWNRSIIEEIKRTDAIIRRLRNFARNNDGAELKLEDLNQAARDTIAMVSFELKRALVHTEFELFNEPIIVLIDRVQIEQVLVNILRNSIDSLLVSKTSTRRIWLQTVLRDGEALFTLRDNGDGLSAENAEAIFQPFNSSKPDGLGLGLAISRSIIEDHDGKIWAESTQEGLTVFIRLPLG